jgi:hypothetical protein
MTKNSKSTKPVTMEEWIERELAKAPKPTGKLVWWVMNRFDFPPEQVEAAYEAMLRKLPDADPS